MEDRKSHSDGRPRFTELLARISVAIVAFILGFFVSFLLVISVAGDWADQYSTPVLLALGALSGGIAYYVSGIIARAIRGHLAWRLVAIASGPLLILMVVSALKMSLAAPPYG